MLIEALGLDNFSQQLRENQNMKDAMDNGNRVVTDYMLQLGNVDNEIQIQEEELLQLKNKINTDDRRLVYENQNTKRNNMLLIFLKVSSILLGLALIGFVMYRIFLIYKVAIIASLEKAKKSIDDFKMK